MDNQHQKIKGYRDLSQEEIDLMNKIKAHGEETKKLLLELESYRVYEDEPENISQKQQMESLRCLYQAKTDLQTGMMWLVRAVALPDSF